MHMDIWPSVKKCLFSVVKRDASRVERGVGWRQKIGGWKQRGDCGGKREGSGVEKREDIIEW